MATLEELFVLRSDPRLVGRFVAAIERAAAQIIREDAGTPNHAERVEWAKRALLEQSQRYAALVLHLAIAENTTLQEQGANVTDNDVLFIANSYVPMLVAAGL